MQRKSIIYKTAKGVEPYVDYVDSLRDRQAATKIKIRVTRAEMGNLGDHRTVGQGVIELKIDFGPGYRVYAALHGNELIVSSSVRWRQVHAREGYFQGARILGRL